MKTLKLFRLFAIVTVMANAASAQVVENDWTRTNGVKMGPQTLSDGTTGHYYESFYSPSTVSRTGDMVTYMMEIVYTDSTPTTFYVVNLNCRTRQYTFASYDIGTTPATLSAPSKWKDVQPNTPGEAVALILCK